jgi:hypothetical protein
VDWIFAIVQAVDDGAVLVHVVIALDEGHVVPALGCRFDVVEAEHPGIHAHVELVLPVELPARQVAVQERSDLQGHEVVQVPVRLPLVAVGENHPEAGLNFQLLASLVVRLEHLRVGDALRLEDIARLVGAPLGVLRDVAGVGDHQRAGSMEVAKNDARGLHRAPRSSSSKSRTKCVASTFAEAISLLSSSRWGMAKMPCVVRTQTEGSKSMCLVTVMTSLESPCPMVR